MKLFFGKNVQKFCVSFIEQNIGEVKEQKVDKVASGCNEDVNKDELVTNEEKEKEEKEEEEEEEEEEKEEEKGEKEKEEEEKKKKQKIENKKRIEQGFSKTFFLTLT